MDGAATPLFSITATTVDPIREIVTSGFSEIVPFGILIMAAFIGVGMIPKLIYRFL